MTSTERAEPGDKISSDTPGTGENLCPKCDGTGEVSGSPCSDCAGTGKVIKPI